MTGAGEGGREICGRVREEFGYGNIQYIMYIVFLMQIIKIENEIPVIYASNANVLLNYAQVHRILRSQYLLIV